MRRHFAATMLLALTAFGPAAGQNVLAAAPGCYRLEMGDWDPRRAEGNEPYQQPPARIALLDSLGDAYFERGKKLARPVISVGHTPSAYWEPLGGDSIRVVWTSGFAGLALRLEVTPAGLRGAAEAFTDLRIPGRALPRARVVGHRSECPAAETD